MRKFIGSSSRVTIWFVAIYITSGLEGPDGWASDLPPLIESSGFPSEKQLRSGIEGIAKGMTTEYYVFDGQHLFALFRKKESERCLILMVPGADLGASVSHGDARVALSREPCFVRVRESVDGGEPDLTTKLMIGGWIEIPDTPTIEIGARYFVDERTAVEWSAVKAKGFWRVVKSPPRRK